MCNSSAQYHMMIYDRHIRISIKLQQGVSFMTISYDTWVAHVFDHPEPPAVDEATRKAHYEKLSRIGQQLTNGEVTYEDVLTDMQPPEWYEWYFHNNSEFLYPTSAQTVAYITRAFNDIQTIAQSFSDVQLNTGINYIINNGCSDYMFALIDEDVPLEKRLDAVESFASVYENLYALRCDNIPIEGGGANPLNTTCYMWWDIIPFYGKSGIEAREALDEMMLTVMQRTLFLDNYTCQQGALHGLGHWHYVYPQQVETTIDAFLKRPNLHEEIILYAKQARTGHIL